MTCAPSVPWKHDIGRAGIKVIAHAIQGRGIAGQQHQMWTRLDPLGGILGIGLGEHSGGRVVLTHVAMKHPHKSIALDLGRLARHEIAHPLHAHIIRAHRHRGVSRGPATLWRRTRVAHHARPTISPFAEHRAIESKYRCVGAERRRRRRRVSPDLPFSAVMCAIGLACLRGEAESSDHCSDYKTFHYFAPHALICWSHRRSLASHVRGNPAYVAQRPQSPLWQNRAHHKREQAQRLTQILPKCCCDS